MEEEFRRRLPAIWRYSDAAKGFTRVDARMHISTYGVRVSISTIIANKHCHYNFINMMNGQRTKIDKYSETADKESY